MLSVLTFPHPRRRGGKGQQHRLRHVGRGLDGQGVQGAVDGASPAAGVVWANTFNRFDPAASFGGMGESGFGREGSRIGLVAHQRIPNDDLRNPAGARECYWARRCYSRAATA